MSLTTAQAFTEFQVDLSVTAYQTQTMIPARRRNVDERLKAKFPATSDMPYLRNTLMGSAAKHTIIRPFDDIDVLAVFSNENDAWSKYRQDSKKFIYRIRDAYDGVSIQQVGTRGQAVRVFYEGGGHVDIAPVFSAGNGVFKLPAGDGTWIDTAPIIANDWYLEKHRALNYRLSPLVRLAKSWNRTHAKRLRSFHLETVAASIFKSIGSNAPESLQKFFTWAPDRLSVSDPGGQSGDLSSYLTSQTWKLAVTSLNSAAERAQRALDAEREGDHDEAKRLWQIILGEDFPTG